MDIKNNIIIGAIVLVLLVAIIFTVKYFIHKNKPICGCHATSEICTCNDTCECSHCQDKD